MATAMVPQTLKGRVSAEEWAIRVELAAAYRAVAHFGWDDLIFTHLSARVPGPEHHFLLNPFDLMFEEITASSLVKIDAEGRPIDREVPVNRAGFIIHSAIHMAREDAQVVLHLHTPHGQAVSAMDEGLLPYVQIAMVAAHGLAYHDYEGIATDAEERERLVADLGTKNSMILRNHGTLTVGSTVGAAFMRMYALERGCEAQVHMLAAGRDRLNTPPQGVAEKVGHQIQNNPVASNVDQLAWAAVMRKMDRIDPGYRE